MNTSIFREYDVRGVVPDDLTPEVVEDLGKAIGTYALARGKETFAVGRDCRVSSPALRDQLIRGLRSTGLNVVDIGMVPTPLLYFSTFVWEVQGGVIITGSHNPPDYNGFKILVGRDSLHGSDIKHLCELIESDQLTTAQPGSLERRDIVSEYIDWVSSNISLGPHPLKIVVDSGNGMGGLVAGPLYRKLGAEVIELYIEPDSTFPNHHPDPTVADNLADLIREVRESGADCGIGYDGDADRIGVITDEGEILWGDKLMILLAREVLADNPGATIISEVKCSKVLFDDVDADGGNGIMWKVGHSLIKAKMKETGALLAGEMSGHIFFKHRYFGFDDAIYTGARFLEILSNSGMKPSQLIADIPVTYATPEIRLPCPEEVKFEVTKRIADDYRERFDVVDIDGVRVIFPDGWGLIRASNTQPVLVLRAEADTAERLAEIKSMLEQTIQDAIG